MSARESNANDIAVTDLENDHVYVIHPKLRKESSQSSQTLETEIGGSSQIIDTSHSPTEHDIELSIIRNVLSPDYNNHGEHVFVIHPKPRNRRHSSQSSQSFEDGSSRQKNCSKPVHTVIEQSDIQNAEDSDNDQNSCQLTVISCLRQMKRFFTIKDKETFNWTIIQTWYNMAFLQCAVPFFFQRNRESNEWEKVSFHPQQVLWAISTTLLVLEMLSWIPIFISSLDEEPNPYVYLRMASFLSAFILRCCFLKLVCCGEKQVLEFLDISSRLLDIIPDENRWLITSKTVVVATSISVLLLNTISVILGLLTRVYFETSELEWTGNGFLHTYACFGKHVLAWWIPNSTCTGNEDVGEPEVSDVLYGVFGIITCANGLISLSNSILCILACTSTLCITVLCIRHVESVSILEVYNILKDIANILSTMVGTVLTVYLMYFAISMPDWIRLAFQSHKIVVISVAINLLVLLTTKFLGCVATLLIDRMKAVLTGPQGVAELPNETKQFTSMFHTIFHNSVGIGYPGLYVLNFRLLFSYLGIIGSIIVVIHETMKDMAKSNDD